NNWCGHGFYQFSPELFYRALTPENGMTLVDLFVADASGRRTYRVVDPASAGERVQLWSGEPIYMLVPAQREAVRPIFQIAPQQADYVHEWRDRAVRKPAGRTARWKQLPIVRDLLARRARRYLMRVRLASLDNRRFFTPVDLKI